MAIGIVVSLGLFYLAVRKVDLGAAWDVARAADPAWLALGVAAVNASVIGMAARWRLLAAGLTSRVPSLRAFGEVILAAQAVNGILPARAGDVVRIAWLGQRSGIGAAAATGSMVVDRAFDVLALTLIIGLGFPFVPQEGWVVAVGLASLAASVGLIAVWLGCRAYSARVRGRGGVPPTGRVRRQLSRFALSVGDSIANARMGRMAAWTAFVWGVWTVGAWAVARSIGLDIGLPEMLFTAGVLNAGLAIPSSPGFVGTYQYLTVSALGLFGVQATPAFAFSVLLQVSWFVPQIVAGLLLLPRVGISFTQLRRGAAAPVAPGAERADRANG